MDNLIFKREGNGKKIVILPILFLFFFMFSLTFISSAQPTVLVPTSAQGIAIEHPISEPIPVNTTHKFHFHVFNASDGRAMNMSITTCTFHLYDPDGNHILKVNDMVSFDDRYDYEQIVTGRNFSYPGMYAYVFQCNTSSIGGFYSKSIDVTPKGNAGGIDINNYFWILIVLTWGVAFVGFFGKNIWIAVMGGFGMMMFGVYTLVKGITIYYNWLTQGIAYFSLGLGAFFAIYSLIEYLEDID